MSKINGNFSSLLGTLGDAAGSVKEKAKNLTSKASEGAHNLGGLASRKMNALKTAPRQNLSDIKQKLSQAKQDVKAFGHDMNDFRKYVLHGDAESNKVMAELKQSIKADLKPVTQGAKPLWNGAKEFASSIRPADTPSSTVPPTAEPPNPRVPDYQPRRNHRRSDPPGANSVGPQPFMAGSKFTEDPVAIGMTTASERSPLLAELGNPPTAAKVTPQYVAEQMRTPSGRDTLSRELKFAIQDIAVASRNAMQRVGEDSPRGRSIGDGADRLINELNNSLQSVGRLRAADIPDADRAACEQLLGVDTKGYSGAYIDTLSNNAEWLGSMTPELKKLEQDISQQYKKVSMKYHPDKARQNGLSTEDANKQFQAIGEARNTLMGLVDGMRARIELHKTGTVSTAQV